MSLRRLLDIVLLAGLAGFGLVLAEDESDAALPVSGQAPPAAASRGWWQMTKQVVANIGDDRVMAEAAGVTFYTLLAIFPAIASLISLYGLIADPSTIYSHLSLLRGVVPDGGMQIIGDQIKALTSTPQKALGLGAVLGILTSLWSANAGIKSLFDALNVVYEVKESRSFLHRTLISLAFTIGGLVFVMLAVSAVVVVPAVLAYVGIGSAADTLLSLARWPLMLVAIAFMLAFIYRYGPSRATARWRWLSWGSAFAAMGWVAASAGFSWYVAHFGSYNKTYGSLGAAVGFMTWIWISTIIVLVGAEVNAALNHHPARGAAARATRATRATRKIDQAEAV
jgi:membrane protein